MNWLNEPPQWTEQGESITMRSTSKTDFWRVTYSGVIMDNGHFYYERRSGNFRAEVKISGAYNSLYDQAGFMLRLNETHWLKCGVEFFEGRQHASVVVTRDFSDWSMVPLPQDVGPFWLRLSRQGTTIEVSYSLDGRNYQMLRQAYLTSVETLDVGLFSASPVGDGFSVNFEQFNIQPLLASS